MSVTAHIQLNGIRVFVVLPESGIFYIKETDESDPSPHDALMRTRGREIPRNRQERRRWVMVRQELKYDINKGIHQQWAAPTHALLE